ncbi:MAG: hypothetical protein LBD34_04105 [Puniceicoccales bacterium]|nr:hypothetical protein [Puniceicoccales bacterium]
MQIGNGDNSPADDSTETFTGDNGLMRNINVSNGSTLYSIYFPEGDFSEKTLTLNNGGITCDNEIPTYLIRVTGKDYATAISLSGVHSTEESPFTVALDNTGGAKEYRFLAEGGATSGSGSTVVIGAYDTNSAPDSSVEINTNKTNYSYFTFDPRGARVKATPPPTPAAVAVAVVVHVHLSPLPSSVWEMRERSTAIYPTGP